MTLSTDTAKVERDYVSFSQIDRYCRCGIQYFLYYEEQIVIPQTPNMIMGTSYHKALEFNHRQKVVSGNDLSNVEMNEIGAEYIEEAFENDVLLSEDDKFKGKMEVKDVVIKRNNAALEVYFKEMAPNIQPLEVEKYFKVNLGDDMPPLVVVIDLITQDFRVVDNKTSAKKPPEGAADDSIQLSTYALAFEHQYGFLPAGLELQYAVVTPKTCAASTVVRKTTRTEEQLDKFKLRLKMVVDGISKRVAIPPPQGDWQCNACGYRELNYCPLYKRNYKPAEQELMSAWF